MNDLKILKSKGFKLQTKWQNLNSKSIFFIGTKNTKNFDFYQNQAIKKNCKFILCNSKFYKLFKKKLTYISFSKNEDLFKIAKIFFQSIKMKIILVTGTNGKTSIAFGTHKLISLNNLNSSYIGTLGFYINSKKIESLSNTTPEYFEILKCISLAQDKNCKFVFIEASSIGYCEKRLGDLKYDYCFLTNLKSDHLDYHKTLLNYHKSKFDIINNQSKKKSKLLIQDDILPNKLKLNKKQIFNQKNLIINNNVTINPRLHNNFTISIKKNIYKIKTINDFVIKNTLSILFLFKIITNKWPKFFNKTIYPNGRSEIVYKNRNTLILIDYAHSLDAFKNLLSTINIKANFTIVLYGCGGDRDKSKRTNIAKLVSKYSDLQIITDDNPRNENPKNIRDVLIKYSKRPISIANREKAIKFAVNLIKEKEGLLIIAGKGHENTQIYKKRTIQFSDIQIVKKYV